MADRRPHVVIAGVSTRALAASACRAGYRVTAVDAFGDADLRVVAEVLPLRRDGGAPYTAQDAARAARLVDAPLAAYTSNFENHPEAVAAAGPRAAGCWATPPAVLARVRNPIAAQARVDRPRLRRPDGARERAARAHATGVAGC